MTQHTEPVLVSERPVRLRRWRAGGLLDDTLFIVTAFLSLLLAAVVLRKGISSWGDLVYLLGFYLVLAYLALPRIHRILTTLYVPDYFIGRTRTGDGLLGDPVNLALVGDGDQIREVMEKAGWVEADPVSLASALRIVASSLLRRSYAHAPVSPLFLFGRQQDFAYQQEVAGNPSQRHHVRFWRCPPGWLLPGGRRVEWLAAGTYDRSVGLSLFTFQVTHKIAADIDVERDHIIGTIRDSRAQVSVEVIENFSTGYHSRNGGGDAVHTDGALPVVDVSAADVPWADERDEPLAMLEDVGRRPLSVAIAVLVILAGIAIQFLEAGFEAHRDFPQTLADSGSSRLEVITVLTVALGLWALAQIAFVWAVFQGVNTARLILLVMVTVSLSVELAHALVRDLPDAASLLRMTAYLAVVYALTSVSARQWTRHQVSNRRARRRRRRS